jgi:hypothetical protein
MAKIGRKVVFFLGAGASFGAGATADIQGGGRIAIPTQATFWDTFLRFSRSPRNRSEIESFLFRYFLGYSRTPARLTPSKRRQMLSNVDVEEVFTFLSERARAPASSAALRTYADKVWVALLAEFGHVFGRFAASSRTRSIFRALRKNFILSRDTVVSFNYDTVFEDSIPKYQWHYDEVESRKDGFRLLKPHGSINWQRGETITVADDPTECVIVAPTHLKFVRTDVDTTNAIGGYLDHSPQINRIWSTMEREMRDAKALVFVGYSFPVADLYFSSVLRSVLADRGEAPGLVIVNPDAVSIEKRLKARFPLAQVLLRYDLANFVQATRQQLLKDLEAARARDA